MSTDNGYSELVRGYATEVRSRLDAIAEMAASGGLDPAVDLLTEAVETGAVIQAFGTGHSEAFSMEIAGRAGRRLRDRIQLRGQRFRGWPGDPGEGEGPRCHRRHLAAAHHASHAQA